MNITSQYQLEHSEEPFIEVEMKTPKGNMFLYSNIKNKKLIFSRGEHLHWANLNYQAIKFVQADPQNDILIISQINGTRVGQGKLVKVTEDASNYELSGIYTLEIYRHHKFAHQMVSHLIQLAKDLNITTLYCIPFSNLNSFYCDFGFRLATKEEAEDFPPKIKRKMMQCSKDYVQDCSCLIMKL